ncbi:MAG: hypothetical protein K2K41_04420, partial [Ruminiclostridium sp.]|nr:hypothetical protein [Ruminiclostridium sp.]
MNIFLSLLTAAETVSETEAYITTAEPTLNDAVHDLAEKPEETLSAIGEFFKGLGRSMLSAVPTIILAIIVLIIGTVLTKLVLSLLSKGLKKTKIELTVTKITVQS